MHRCGFILAVFVSALTVSPSPAGIPFFGKHTKPNPNERVPELLNLIATSNDEHKRSTAVEELRQYDVAAFPDMIPLLLEVLAKDPKPAVRSEAAETLSKLRPVSKQVGKALELAQNQDPSMRVRIQARHALLHYHWSGYHSSKKDDPLVLQTNEPPLSAGAATGLGGLRPTSSTSLKPMDNPPTAPNAATAPPKTNIWSRLKPSSAEPAKSKMPAQDDGPRLFPQR
jgi:hypothetical protein